MYCKYCGERIDSDSIFCMVCGKNLNDNMKTLNEEPIEEPAEEPDIIKSEKPDPISINAEKSPCAPSQTARTLNPMIKVRQIVSLIISAIILILAFMPLVNVSEYEMFNHSNTVFNHSYNIFEIEQFLKNIPQDGDTPQTIIGIYLMILFPYAAFIVYYLFRFSRPPANDVEGDLMISSVRFTFSFFLVMVILCAYIIFIFSYLNSHPFYENKVSLTMSSITIFILTAANIIINVMTRSIPIYIDAKN